MYEKYVKLKPKWSLQWITTSYNLYSNRIEIEYRLLSREISVIYFNRIKDIELRQTIGNRLTRTYDIIIYSSDLTDGKLLLNNINQGHLVFNKLQELIIREKNKIHRMESI